jgi:hypothetical protein
MIFKKYWPSIVVVFIVVCMALIAQHVVRSDAAFSHAYLEYAAAADDADTASYVPTATNNPVRVELNMALTTALGNSLPAAKRLAQAERGLELLKASKVQIDDIGVKNDAVASAIKKMEESLAPGDAIFQRGDPQKIIAFAKERAAATNDIRALSYKADFETTKIFQHLVSTKGELTDSYVRELNSTIPAEEEDFNKRQNRYSDLQTLLGEIQAAYADFRSATAGAF